VNIDFLELPNIRVLKAKLPDDLYSKILNECLHCEENNVKFNTGLTATGVPTHYRLKDTRDDLFNFLKIVVREWLDQHPDFVKTHYTILSKDCPFYNDEPWINIQRQNEFLPIHKHDGILSYSIWVKLPNREHDKWSRSSEKVWNKNTEKYYSFQFVYNSILGLTCCHDFRLGKKDEGTMLLFPSNLQHLVFPFYSSDEKRISVSGNIKLRVE
tara:strand:+ start:18 stop:656 length:639 start_codon:yes stop_codon:yes gene_type:complete